MRNMFKCILSALALVLFCTVLYTIGFYSREQALVTVAVAVTDIVTKGDTAATEGKAVPETPSEPEEPAALGTGAEAAEQGATEQAAEDTTAPVIEGAEDITIYAGESVSYRRNITLTDDSGEEPSIEIDSGSADIATAGDYPIRYIARDGAGNETIVEIILHVLEPPEISEQTVNELADQVIAQAVTEDMTQYEQAYALWEWCRSSISFTDTEGDRSSVWRGAYDGLKEGKGDCYVFYATYAFLLTRCGIENMCVRRTGGTSDHWWNLVNTGSGWYHCDTSPRNRNYPYKCFMQTDAQVQAYTESYTRIPSYYSFDPDLYPERATEVIFEE